MKWNIYIMIGNLKVYLRKAMTTMEAVKWLEAKCTSRNSHYFIGATQVFCEGR